MKDADAEANAASIFTGFLKLLLLLLGGKRFEILEGNRFARQICCDRTAKITSPPVPRGCILFSVYIFCDVGTAF